MWFALARTIVLRDSGGRAVVVRADGRVGVRRGAGERGTTFVARAAPCAAGRGSAAGGAATRLRVTLHSAERGGALRCDANGYVRCGTRGEEASIFRFAPTPASPSW